MLMTVAKFVTMIGKDHLNEWVIYKKNYDILSTSIIIILYDIIT